MDEYETLLLAALQEARNHVAENNEYGKRQGGMPNRNGDYNEYAVGAVNGLERAYKILELVKQKQAEPAAPTPDEISKSELAEQHDEDLHQFRTTGSL